MKIEVHRSFKHKMIELKARVTDHKFFRKRLSDLGAQYIGTFRQTDLYFQVPEGRLKLRQIEDEGIAELIYYERKNIPRPKIDDVLIFKIQEPEDLKKILKKILTPLTVIEKTREIYQYKGTKIHLDTVKKLGKFIEFERQTSDDSTVVAKDGRILENLIEKLRIDPNNLEPFSYSDFPQT